MNTIILFYKYIIIQCPKKILEWQQTICNNFNLKGRILISHEGINGTLGGIQNDIDQYIDTMLSHELFNDIDFKKSLGGPECFPRLSIKIRNEAVSLGIPYDQLTPKNGGIHLTPKETHALISENPDDLVIFDARNNYEWEIGRFTNAITAPIKNFRDLPDYLDNNSDLFKNKQVLMYCTGGIRCERATAYLNEKKIAKKVYQIKGGIHRYTEEYPNGFFRGKNYVFDGRISLKINDDILSTCTICKVRCDEYNNCINASCNNHFIACSPCVTSLQKTCSITCKQLITEEKATLRPEFNKINSLV